VHAGVEFVALEEAHFFDATLMDVVRILVGRGVDVVLTSLDLNCWASLCDRGYPAAPGRRALHLTARCARCGARPITRND